jgi:uncharacterized protein (TIGR03067 family)
MTVATPVLTPADPRARADLELLQGAWEAVAGPRRAQLLIAGNRFTFEFLDGDIYMGSFFLETDTEPRQMDMLIEEGPADAKGLLALCIYHVAAGVLRWCPTKPGTDRRLSSFPGVDDGRYNSMVFKHLRPRKPR